MIRDLPLLLTLLALALLLAWAPIPFASVTFEGRALLQAGCAVALFLVAVSRREGALGRGARAPAVALLLVAGWGALQAIDLPAAVVRALSPEAATLRATAAGLTAR